MPVLEASLLAKDERARCPRTVLVVEVFLLLSPLSPRLRTLGLRGPSPRPIDQVRGAAQHRGVRGQMGERWIVRWSTTAT